MTRRQARLIFALDATASREPTWRQARSLHGALFDAAASESSLSVQLCYYRGVAEFRTSDWLSAPAALLDQMNGVTCAAGITQIGRLVRHGLSAGSANQPIRALIFVGDACEEPADELFGRSVRPPESAPIYLSGGPDQHVQAIFNNMAKLSGGARLP